MHTERLDADWIVRFVRFHGIRSRSNNLFPAEPTIEAFLTDLAVHGNVAAATQNLAMNALVFLHNRSSAKRCRAASMPCADKKINAPWS